MSEQHTPRDKGKNKSNSSNADDSDDDESKPINLAEYYSKENLKRMASASKLIDKQLKDEKKQLERHVKLLLLGTGDSGKSTFCKQMTLLHKKFSEDELKMYTQTVKKNAITSMQVLIDALQQLDIEMPKKLNDDIEKIKSATELTSDVAASIKKLWEDKSIQKVWKKKNKLQIPSNAEYYFTNVDRFAKKNFVATEEDIMRARLKTSGVHETDFTVNGVRFTMIDVGGQRNERKKWIHFFDGVSAVIYLSALDEYDMVLEEDKKTNRMKESLDLFKQLSEINYLQEKSFILFLNKVDLFKLKIEIKKSPLENLFPDYDGGSNYDNGINFIRDQYQKQFKGKNALYFHTTCALDKNNCERVFNAVRDSLLREHMEAGGF